MTSDTVQVRIVCPECKGGLDFAAARIVCHSCSLEFSYQAGFPDLIIGDRFDDSANAERNAYEEECNEYTTRNYFIPTFKRIFSESSIARGRKPRLLSLGCGTGVDVDMLSDEGFEVYGIDCGMRCTAWNNRRSAQRLLLANGMKLPFEAGSFDLVYCGCVFPHVGAKGEAREVRPEYLQERQAIASEMSRVLIPGGFALTSSPNRYFPLDIFHGRSDENPWPAVNMPGNPFLLAASDYRQLFARAGCEASRMMPVHGYWGFIRRKKSVKGALTAYPLEALFQSLSTPALSWLRGSPVSPWLVMLMKKGVHW